MGGRHGRDSRQSGLEIAHTNGYKGDTESPFVKLKVADQEFDKVKVEEMPDMKDKVGAVMADKYWMDVLIRYESHPMVAHLVPEAAPPETPSH